MERRSSPAINSKAAAKSKMDPYYLICCACMAWTLTIVLFSGSTGYRQTACYHQEWHGWIGA
jgi:hypothetical protein